MEEFPEKDPQEKEDMEQEHSIRLTVDMLRLKQIKREVGQTPDGIPITIVIRDMDLQEFAGLWKHFDRDKMIKGVQLLTTKTKQPDEAVELMQDELMPQDVDEEIIQDSLKALASIAEQVIVEPHLTKKDILKARGLMGLNILLEVWNVVFASMRAEDTLKKISSMTHI